MKRAQRPGSVTIPFPVRLFVLAGSWLFSALSGAAQPNSSSLMKLPAGVKEQSFLLAHHAGNMHYFIKPARNSDTVTSALVVMHGYPHDAVNTLEAASQAAEGLAGADSVPIIAPFFQLPLRLTSRCSSQGLPVSQPGDALWDCHSWLDGGKDRAKAVGAFQATDQLLAHLKQKWPDLRQVTLAGFSAGGQFVQHYAGFAKPPSGLHMSYVISDPGSWLYFDAIYPTTHCPQAGQWKYGLGKMPPELEEQAGQARERYRRADITYLEGAEDRGKGAGRDYRILDKSCAAMLQGTYRLDRGIHYARYDREMLAPLTPHRLYIVAGCDHKVGCVFPSAEGKRALFASGR